MPKTTVKFICNNGTTVEIECDQVDDAITVEINGENVAAIDLGGGSIGTWEDPEEQEWERRIEIGSALGAPEGEGLFHLADEV